MVKVQKLGLRVVKGNSVVCSPGKYYCHSCFEGLSIFHSCSAISDKDNVIDIAWGPEDWVGLLEGIEQGVQVYEKEDRQYGGALWNSSLYGVLDIGLGIKRQYCTAFTKKGGVP
jgi:hypothetical protein